MDMSNHPHTQGCEDERLAALADLAILDTPAEHEFDSLTRLAANALKTRSAAISLIDADRQWFKAHHAIPFQETPRDIAFCDHAVRIGRTLVVKDAREDIRFCNNPLVTGETGIRFYAGAPIFAASGACVGTLCIIDDKPRATFEDAERKVLEDFARLAGELIRARAKRRADEIAAKVIDTTSDAVIAVDRSGTIVFLNAAGERMFGHLSQDALGHHVDLLIPERFQTWQQSVAENAAPDDQAHLFGASVELEARHADGHQFPVELSFAPWGEAQAEGGFAAIVRDISERKQLESDRHHARQFLNTIVTNLPVMLFVKDACTRKYLFLNKKAEELIGRSADQLIGHSDSELFPGVGENFERRDRLAAASSEPFVHESVFTKDNGTRVNIRTTRVLADGPDRPAQYILGMAEDLTRMRDTEAENDRLARSDPLTGLLNRARLVEALHEMVGEQTPFATLSIDLDRFKAVNDQFGHLAGDEVLKEVGRRLAEVTEQTDLVARMAGDEFTVVLTGSRLRERAARVANRLIESLAMPIMTTCHTAHIGATVGIVIFPDHGTSVEELREHGDLALYRAKNDKRGSICFFDAEMDAAIKDRFKLEVDLRTAIEAREVQLQYQPVVSSATGRMTSVEALARWRHGSRGPVRPDDFIALAEECGLINVMGAQLLAQACADASKWPSDIKVAVNLSPMQFQSGDLTEIISAALEKTGLEPARLQLEVTERMVIQDAERTFVQLEALRALGIQILIDDFGVGYSSLSYFQRFPFDKVKIDKSFVREVETSRSSRAIVRAVVGLARELEMGIVAEGIELERQRATLTKLGCTHLQGYLFSKPLDADEVLAFAASLKDRRQAA
ncbi:sensor domain-containing phosphodiesterase [Aurantiacibacter suaedae]|uniref:sensor domain-containing phosphodiesterase n=1 Tax=Aurantiacibacter suaedae TaxID=2545755 RepID=UPI0010FA010E|nr:EAL domain-containing protein [Aurantiacibacter suaedae]